MRKHLKYLKKEKGLTLIELLAVLVILGIIAVIAIPMIGNIIGNSENEATVNDALNIIAAAKLADANGIKSTSATEDVTYLQSELGEYVDSTDFVSVTKDVTADTDTNKVTKVEWIINGHEAYNVVKKQNVKDLNETHSVKESELKGYLK